MYNIRIYALNLDNSTESVKFTKSCRDFIQTKLQESDQFIKFTKSKALNGSEAVTKVFTELLTMHSGSLTIILLFNKDGSAPPLYRLLEESCSNSITININIQEPSNIKSIIDINYNKILDSSVKQLIYSIEKNKVPLLRQFQTVIQNETTSLSIDTESEINKNLNRATIF